MQRRENIVEIDFLIDTDILVEVFRASKGAKEWFASIQEKIIAIPILVYLEILQGAESKKQQKLLMKQMKEYKIIHLESGDSELAQEWFEHFYLSHGFGLVDALIASIVRRVNKPLYTFNAKHFKMIKELDVRIPYQREK